MKRKIKLKSVENSHFECHETDIAIIKMECDRSKHIKRSELKKNKQGDYLLIEAKSGVKFVFNGKKITLKEIPITDSELSNMLLLMDDLGLRDIDTTSDQENKNDFEEKMEPIIKQHKKTAKVLRAHDMFR